MTETQPPPRQPDLPGRLRALAAGRPVIVLDDDPTGTQTVRDVPVLTRWSEERLASLIGSGAPVAYLLTNSRSIPSSDAAALARSIGKALRAAAARTETAISVISRSDSTLRGHFPVEVDALAEGLGMPDARVLLAPFFGDGGRVTIAGVHHLRRDGIDIPVAETEFARDPVFGYRSSDLREWVAERCGDDSRAVEVVDLGTLRERGPVAVREALLGLPARGVLVVDAVEERDIEIAALGALDAELAGLPLIARTAASYARARSGQAPAPILEDRDLHPGVPGLIIVGSHVPTTSRQLDMLLATPPTALAAFELDVDAVLTRPEAAERLARTLASHAGAAIERGQTPVMFTSRTLSRGNDAAADLDIAARVSRTLVEAVRRIGQRPAWVLAKGGITSSDIATHALDLAEATVLGPLLPGVPTWRCGPDSRWPGLTYVVFPGNVGGPTALREAVLRLVGGV